MAARRRVVVIGAGSAGCVVAERVSRSGADDVVILEAGGPAPHAIDIGVLPLTDPTRVRVHHDRDGTPLPRGRGLGGSSAVNGGYFLRPHRGDLVDWDPEVWSPETVERAYTMLDGGDEGGGTMAVHVTSEDEMHSRAAAFETAMYRAGYPLVRGAWPGAGIVRVRRNGEGRIRRTAADAFLADAVRRRGVDVRTDVAADGVDIGPDGVRSVVLTDGAVVPADVVVLCAGTVGSATIAARSGLAATFPLAEHRELLVRSRPVATTTGPVGPVLQTVVHTDDGFEIRCYAHDFADHIVGVPRSGAAIGVAAMRSVGEGSITVAHDGTVDIDLGVPDDAGLTRMRQLADEVAAMLEGPAFAGLVEPGSTAVDATLSTSQHAWGVIPLGTAADWDGRVRGVDGLWVADASALPTALSSGPHETVMMLASVVAERIATTRD